jgi:hypothetical protein
MYIFSAFLSQSGYRQVIIIIIITIIIRIANLSEVE